FTHQLFQIAGGECLISTNSDLGLPGYTFTGPKSIAEPLWVALTQVVTTPGTAEAWETLRVMQGRPMPSHELTEDENPLEAGLWHSISFEKGCYIGQETIARLNTYKGVKKRLWGFQLQTPVTPGAVIYVAEARAGNITSVTQTPDGATFALGYLRTKAGGEGLSVEIDGVSAEAIALPFVEHKDYVAAPSA
ncbi:MAG: glycine cleavage T C-terminal barrel domain-containing protein, partial [Cyanobacteria bacterium J06635_11]